MDISRLLRGKKPKRRESSSNRPSNRPRQSLPANYGLQNVPPFFPPGSLPPRGPPLGHPPLFPGIAPSSASKKPNDKKKRVYTCDQCGRKFLQRSDRNKHEKTVHFKERKCYCKICGVGFGEVGNLNKVRRCKSSSDTLQIWLIAFFNNEADFVSYSIPTFPIFF